MLIFFTVLFLIFYIVSISKGKLFHSFLIEIGEEEVRKQKVGIDNFKLDEDLAIKSLLLGLVILPILITQVIYYCFALPVDVYKYPTLALLTLTIFNLIVAFIKGKSQKKIDLSTEDKIEKYRKKLKKKRTIKGTSFQLIYIIYFAYMFYILVF